MVRNFLFVWYIFSVLCFVHLCYCAQDTESNEINEGNFVYSSNEDDVKLEQIKKVEALSEATSTSAKPNVTKPNVTKPTITKPPREKLVCPSRQTRIPFFSPTCKTTRDCSFFGANLVCCFARCIRGVVPPKPEPSHSPLFGVIDRVCPVDPMPELLAVQECTVDADCGPRICCPERPSQGVSGKNYCRNGAPRFHRMPAVRQFLLPLKTFASYLQCTPPPPPFFDIFPTPCESPFDCFPSLCCQENGKRFCRPPKKSLFALIAGAAQRLGTASLARSFIQRIS